MNDEPNAPVLTFETRDGNDRNQGKVFRRPSHVILETRDKQTERQIKRETEQTVYVHITSNELQHCFNKLMKNTVFSWALLILIALQVILNSRSLVTNLGKGFVSLALAIKVSMMNIFIKISQTLTTWAEYEIHLNGDNIFHEISKYLKSQSKINSE